MSGLVVAYTEWCHDKLRVEADGFFVVLDGPLVLPQVTVCAFVERFVNDTSSGASPTVVLAVSSASDWGMSCGPANPSYFTIDKICQETGRLTNSFGQWWRSLGSVDARSRRRQRQPKRGRQSATLFFIPTVVRRYFRPFLMFDGVERYS